MADIPEYVLDKIVHALDRIERDPLEAHRLWKLDSERLLEMIQQSLSDIDLADLEFVMKNFAIILEFTKEMVKKKHQSYSEPRSIFPEIVNLIKIKDPQVIGEEIISNRGGLKTQDEGDFVDFSCFSNMPFEVQDGIWEAALNLFVGPRVIETFVGRNHTNKISKISHVDIFRFQGICHRSFDTVRRLCTPIRLNDLGMTSYDTASIMLMNFKKDTILFNSTPSFNELALYINTPASIASECFKNIRFIVMSQDVLAEGRQKIKEVIKTLDALPNLKEISWVDYERDYFSGRDLTVGSPFTLVPNNTHGRDTLRNSTKQWNNMVKKGESLGDDVRVKWSSLVRICKVYQLSTELQRARLQEAKNRKLEVNILEIYRLMEENRLAEQRRLKRNCRTRQKRLKLNYLTGQQQI